MNVVDLRSYLESWPYDAQKNVRLGQGADGRQIILVRQPMGIEQYEVDGPPDGRPISRMERTLDFHRCHNQAGRQIQPGSSGLTAEDCADLFEEARAYYHRLIVLFRLKDWARAERDAAQILQLLENIEQQVPCAEDRMQLESWRSHLTKIKAVTQAMVLWDKRQYRDAFESVRDTLGFPEVMNGAAQDQEGFVETLLKSVQGALTARPALHPGEESSFFRQGDFWVIRYQGHSAFLKATRGLQYLRFLLGSPGREFHVNEFLADIPDPMAAASAASGNGRLHEDGARCVTSGLNDGSPILDAKAKADYKRRLSELREELDEAERFSDPARAAKAQDEMNVITGQMASALGLGGRDRKTSSGAERARSAVTKSIKKTIQKVSETIPSLGLHLAARIKTGYFCSYTPHPDRPVAWKF